MFVTILRADRVLDYGTCQDHALKIIMARLSIQTATISRIPEDFVKPKAKTEVRTSFIGCTVCGY